MHTLYVRYYVGWMKFKIIYPINDFYKDGDIN